MPRIIVERSFETPLTQEELDAVEKRWRLVSISTTFAGFAAIGPPTGAA